MLKRPDKPEPLPELPPPPELSPRAAEEWHRITAELISLGVLSRFDTGLLACYCTAYALWIEATKRVQEDGALIKSPNGYEIQNPSVAIMNKQATLLLRLADQLGFSPAARLRHFTADVRRKMLLHDPNPVDEFGMPVVA